MSEQRGDDGSVAIGDSEGEGPAVQFVRAIRDDGRVREENLDCGEVAAVCGFGERRGQGAIEIGAVC